MESKAMPTNRTKNNLFVTIKLVHASKSITKNYYLCEVEKKIEIGTDR